MKGGKGHFISCCAKRLTDDHYDLSIYQTSNFIEICTGREANAAFVESTLLFMISNS